MNEKHTRYVLEILRQGSFTEAARVLRISQPSLSQTIKQVEQRLGAPIFVRSADAVQLTMAGEAYLQAARQVIAIEAGLAHRIDALKGEVHGVMRLGIATQLCITLLPQVLPRFAARYPHVQVQLIEHGSATLETLVREGACDIALIMTTPKDGDVQYTLLQSQQHGLIAAQQTALARRIPAGTAIEITEAVDEAFVSLRPGHNVRAFQDVLFARHHMAPRIYLETESLEAAKRITAGVGAVMLCPYVHVRDDEQLLRRVSWYPILSGGYERHLYLCHLRQQYITAYMQAFIDEVKAALD